MGESSIAANGRVDRSVRAQEDPLSLNAGNRAIEILLWTDGVSLGGWQYLSEMTEWGARAIITVGIIIEETDDDLIIAMSIGDAGAGEVACNWLCVPKSAIIKRTTLCSNADVTGFPERSVGKSELT